MFGINVQNEKLFSTVVTTSQLLIQLTRCSPIISGQASVALTKQVTNTTLLFSLTGFRRHRLRFELQSRACLSHLGKLVEFGQVVWPSVYSRWRGSGMQVRQHSLFPPPSVTSAAPPKQILPCNFENTIHKRFIIIYYLPQLTISKMIKRNTWTLSRCPCAGKEDIRWKWSRAPRIPNLGASCRLVVSFTPRPLYPWENSPCYPLNRRIHDLQVQYIQYEAKKNKLPLPRIEPGFVSCPDLNLLFLRSKLSLFQTKIQRPLFKESHKLTAWFKISYFHEYRHFSFTDGGRCGHSEKQKQLSSQSSFPSERMQEEVCSHTK
jgi:hypothetical protein